MSKKKLTHKSKINQIFFEILKNIKYIFNSISFCLLYKKKTNHKASSQRDMSHHHHKHHQRNHLLVELPPLSDSTVIALIAPINHGGWLGEGVVD